MVEVFKTNVGRADQSEKLIGQISNHVPGGRINFDLEDCDRILRVEADRISSKAIIELLRQHGFQAEVLQ